MLPAQEDTYSSDKHSRTEQPPLGTSMITASNRYAANRASTRWYPGMSERHGDGGIPLEVRDFFELVIVFERAGRPRNEARGCSARRPPPKNQGPLTLGP